MSLGSRQWFNFLQVYSDFGLFRHLFVLFCCLCEKPPFHVKSVAKCVHQVSQEFLPELVCIQQQYFCQAHCVTGVDLFIHSAWKTLAVLVSVHINECRQQCVLCLKFQFSEVVRVSATVRVCEHVMLIIAEDLSCSGRATGSCCTG